jgi:hypothetical protein
MFISIKYLIEALNAMHWVIAPYADYETFDDYPHIKSLACSYNSMLESLESKGFDHTFSFFKI